MTALVALPPGAVRRGVTVIEYVDCAYRVRCACGQPFRVRVDMLSHANAGRPDLVCPPCKPLRGGK